jgi:copper transport protein
MTVGVAWFFVLCIPQRADDRRLRRVLLAGWLTLAVVTAGVLVIQGPYAAGLGMGQITDARFLHDTLATRLGKAAALRLLLLGAFSPVLMSLASRTRAVPPAAIALGAAMTAALAGTWAVAGHAGTGSQVPLALSADIAHLSAMAIWLGGLVALSTVLWGPATDGRELMDTVSRFSKIAFGCVCVLVVTGSYQLWRQVGTLPALTGTAYGRLLLIKLGGIVALFGLGGFARTWIDRYAEPLRRARGSGIDRQALGLLRRSVGAEVGIGASVLAVTAVLVSAAPARTAFTAPVSRGIAFDTHGPNGTGTVDVVVDPAKVGANAVHVSVLGPNGELEAVPEVKAAIVLPARALGPLSVPLLPSGPGHYSATAPIPIAGTWQLEITVRTDDVNETTVSLSLPIR